MTIKEFKKLIARWDDDKEIVWEIVDRYGHKNNAITAKVSKSSMLDDEWVGTSNGIDVRIGLHLNQVNVSETYDGVEMRNVKMTFVKDK